MTSTTGIKDEEMGKPELSKGSRSDLDGKIVDPWKAYVEAVDASFPLIIKNGRH